jgi:thymidylate synthase ThyX
MLGAAWSLMKLGLHKQLANRLLEPWAYITVIVSATDLDNLFALRCHPDAQPEIRRAVEALRAAVAASEPRHLRMGEWHLPFVTDDERAALPIGTLVKLAVARCARISYLTHDGKRDPERDVQLHDQLLQSRHLSPFEHVAMALDWPVRHGNFTGFKQARKDIAGEDGERA